ncbi:MAG: 30S ribosomal protein S3 [Candidatus Woesearchaeota archaeon]
MIERKFVKQNLTEQRIQEYIFSKLGKVGVSKVKLQLTPLGEKIIIYSSHPGLVVGSGGENIKSITAQLKKKFELENPQIEISEVKNPNADAQIVADKIASALERYGSKNFKGIMHRAIKDVLNEGVRGVEVVLSGKIPSSRAKSWRILSGYMKKCGDIAVTDVKFAKSTAKLKSGVIGVKVRIMPSGITMPDSVKIKEEILTEEPAKKIEEVAEAEKTIIVEEENKKEENSQKQKTKKKTTKKKDDKEIKNV